MAIDPTIITAAIVFVVGTGSGAFWAWLGWLKSGEPFEPRKFTLGIVTGVISALGLVALNLTGILNAVTAIEQIQALLGLFLAVGGADTLRTGITGTIRETQESEPKPIV